MGSVKDTEVLKEPLNGSMGDGRFHFSDRYSVFDWGEMPDHLKNKGAALCMMSGYFFEMARGMGIRTHYYSMGPEFLRTDTIKEPTNIMNIRIVRVIKPEPVMKDDKIIGYDYGRFQNETGNFVIPLEVIYRNYLPQGSSVFKRLKEGNLTLEEMGLTEMPREGQKLPKQFFDASTKYEEFDRYPGWAELQRLAGLSDEELGDIRNSLSEINTGMTDVFAYAGFGNYDGKVEFAFTPERKLMLVDTLGTLDECRIPYKSVDISKEIPRQYYRHTQPGWVAEIDAAKKQSKKGWKPLVKSGPEPLPKELKEIIENIYMSVANRVLGKNMFRGAVDIDELLHEYGRFRELNMKAV